MTKLSASSQDYLEAVLDLSGSGKKIRSIDIAERLGVSRASVNRAMNVLKEAGYVTQERYQDIVLTASGIEAGKAVRARHEALKRFLIDILGVSGNTAEEDACRMEHSLSIESLTKLQQFLSSYCQ